MNEYMHISITPFTFYALCFMLQSDFFFPLNIPMFTCHGVLKYYISPLFDLILLFFLDLFLPGSVDFFFSSFSFTNLASCFFLFQKEKAKDYLHHINLFLGLAFLRRCLNQHYA